MACDHRARHRTSRCGILYVGYRHEARRYPRARRGVLCDAAALDRVSDDGGLCEAECRDRHRRGADRRRRPDRGEGYDLEALKRFYLLSAVIPGRAKREPGISRFRVRAKWAHPGMMAFGLVR